MAKRGEYVRPTYTLICQWEPCGRQFTSAHDWARYCSDAHRLKASRQRKKEKAAREQERQPG
jgi:hypothetical protein